LQSQFCPETSASWLSSITVPLVTNLSLGYFESVASHQRKASDRFCAQLWKTRGPL
jgi:hypothetical protein